MWSMEFYSTSCCQWRQKGASHRKLRYAGVHLSVGLWLKVHETRNGLDSLGTHGCAPGCRLSITSWIFQRAEGNPALALDPQQHGSTASCWGAGFQPCCAALAGLSHPLSSTSAGSCNVHHHHRSWQKQSCPKQASDPDVPEPASHLPWEFWFGNTGSTEPIPASLFFFLSHHPLWILQDRLWL